MLRATALITMFSALMMLTGCNTLTGVGKDVQLVGHGVGSIGEGTGDFATGMAQEDQRLAGQPWPAEPQRIRILPPDTDEFFVIEDQPQQPHRAADGYQVTETDRASGDAAWQHYQQHRQYQQLD